MAGVLKDIGAKQEKKEEMLEKTEKWLKDHQKMVEYEREIRKLFRERPKKRKGKGESKTIELREERRSSRKGVRDVVDEELEPFRSGNRTLIPTLQPATERIKLYDRKQIIVLS